MGAWGHEGTVHGGYEELAQRHEAPFGARDTGMLACGSVAYALRSGGSSRAAGTRVSCQKRVACVA